MAFVAELPLPVAELGDHIPAVVTVKNIIGAGTFIAESRMGVSDERRFEIPSADTPEG